MGSRVNHLLRHRPGRNRPENWPAVEGWPWLVLGLAALSAPFAVLDQGGDGRTAVLAGLACLASPCFAIEVMQGLARLALAMAPDRE